MRKLIMVTVVFVLAGLSASYAQGGMHGPRTHGLMTPPNPTVPPSLTPDCASRGPRLFHPIVSRQRRMFLRFQTPC